MFCATAYSSEADMPQCAQRRKICDKYALKPICMGASSYIFNSNKISGAGIWLTDWPARPTAKARGLGPMMVWQAGLTSPFDSHERRSHDPEANPVRTRRPAAKTRSPERAMPPTVLITGASSGIGEALAICFSQAGYDSILVARSEDKLSALRQRLKTEFGVTGHVLAVDLAKPAAANKLASAVARKKLTVDVLVNCAGVLHQGPFSSMTGATHQQMIDLNISGLTGMLAAFLPAMTRRAASGKTLRILNVASIAAYQPVPILATYAAQSVCAVARRIAGRRTQGRRHHRDHPVPWHDGYRDAEQRGWRQQQNQPDTELYGRPGRNGGTRRNERLPARRCDLCARRSESGAGGWVAHSA